MFGVCVGGGFGVGVIVFVEGGVAVDVVLVGEIVGVVVFVGV